MYKRPECPQAGRETGEVTSAMCEESKMTVRTKREPVPPAHQPWKHRNRRLGELVLGWLHQPPAGSNISGFNSVELINLSLAMAPCCGSLRQITDGNGRLRLPISELRPRTFTVGVSHIHKPSMRSVKWLIEENHPQIRRMVPQLKTSESKH